MRPEVGDKITAFDGDTVLFGAVIVFHNPFKNADDFYWMPERADLKAVMYSRYENEGLSWIRGWHHEESDEVRALLAANRLWGSPGVIGPCPTGPQGAIGVSGIP